MVDNKTTQKKQNYQLNRPIKLWDKFKIPLILFGLCFLLYGNTIINEYSIDDAIVTNNPVIAKGIKAIPEIFTTRYRIQGQYNYGYRPIVKSSFAIQHQIFGENPHVGHFFNVLFYAITVIFLYLLLRKLLRNYDKILPLIITLLFISHPVHTEAVASLKNREEIFSFLGSLAALYFFLRFSELRKARYCIFGLLCYGLAFFSKQNALTFLAIIPLTIFYFSGTSLGFLKDLLSLLRIGYLSAKSKAHRMLWIRILYVFKVVFRNFLLMLALGSYCLGIIKGGGGFFEWCIIFVILHYNFSSKQNWKDFIKGMQNQYVILGFGFMIIYGITASLYLNGKFESYWFSTISGIIMIISFSIYIYRYNLNLVSRFLKAVKGLYMLFFIVTFIAAIILRSYNYYFTEVLVLYTFSILFLWMQLFKKKRNLIIQDKKPYLKVFVEPIPFPGFNMPGIVRVLLVIMPILMLLSYALIYGPNQYLPEEQRELLVYENPLFYESDVWVTIASGFYSLLIYLKLLILPHPLVFYYGFNHIPIVDMTNGWVIFSLILHLGLFAYALFDLKRKTLVSYGIFYYLITISIFSNLFFAIPGIVGERLLFMPSLGFCIVFGYSIFKILIKDGTPTEINRIVRNKILLVTIIILVPYSAKTISRNTYWKDHLTLYLHDIPVLKNSLHANALVASHLLQEINPKIQSEDEINIRMDQAVKHFEQVLELDNNETRTLNNLGTIYYDFYGQYERGISYFDRAVKIDPGFSAAWLNKGHCHEQLAEYLKAKSAYLQALSFRENDIQIISSLARVCYNLGELNEAKELNEKISKIDPKLDLPYLNMADYHLKLGNESAAVVYFEEAVKINPKNKALCKNLGDYFLEQKDSSKAMYYYQLAK